MFERSSLNQNNDVLTYPTVPREAGRQFALAAIVVLIVLVAHYGVLVFQTKVNGGNLLPDFFASSNVQAAAWAPYILGEGTWWFAAALAILAFLLPSALVAPQEGSPIPGVVLRTYYANGATIVGPVSVTILVFAYFGAEYSEPTTAIRLFLLSVATLIILLISALISSFGGYDLIASLQYRKEQGEKKLELRKRYIQPAHGFEEQVKTLSGLKQVLWKSVFRALLLGAFQLVLIPVFVAITVFRDGLASETFIAVWGLWGVFLITTLFLAICSVTPTAHYLVRWGIRAVVTIINSSVLGVSVAFIIAVKINPSSLMFYGMFGAISVFFFFFTNAYVEVLGKGCFKRVLPWSFLGMVLVSMAWFTQMRLVDLVEKINKAESKRQGISYEDRESASILLPNRIEIAKFGVKKPIL